MGKSVLKCICYILCTVISANTFINACFKFTFIKFKQTNVLNDLVLPPNQLRQKRNKITNRRRISKGIIILVARKEERVVIKRIKNNKLGIRGVKVVVVIITIKSNNRRNKRSKRRRRHHYYQRMRLRNDWHVLKSMVLLKV